MPCALTAALSIVLVFMGLGGLGAAPANAASKTISTRYLVNYLPGAREHVDGYDRAKFRLWVDADHDGCDTRDEVLTKEAIVQPWIAPGCVLRGGEWRSEYDGVVTRDASTFDIDHMVPLNEAWQSGAWKWTAAKRQAYANDLGYKASLIAVSASSNRSKGDREPQSWMPLRPGYQCGYAKRWVAVKWRWQLRVDAAERAWLATELKACGWPRVVKPGKPVIPSTGGSTGDRGSGGGSGPVTGSPVNYAVHPGAFCSEHWQYGHTSAGTLMRCTTTATDSRFRWRSA
jgi:hypothetical protein